MRLINLQTLELKTFEQHNVPPYAILSHRWGRQEVTYKDLRTRRNLVGPGYDKVTEFCAFARRLKRPVEKAHRLAASTHPALYECTNNLAPLRWGWLDTICIDKSSSAELSEAINSMFRWYEEAAVCCVYLADIPDLDAELSVPRKPIRESEWFKRGWTLQELLAPSDILFCDASWQVLGHKCRWPPLLSQLASGSSGYACECGLERGLRLNDQITRATGISGEYLLGSRHVLHASIACRMSWAARRVTTRAEDMAYCLLGLLNVHIPILYGEGLGAFRRLQEELVRRSNDQSIFAWSHPGNWLRDDGTLIATPLLAISPIDFVNSGDIEATGDAPMWPYATTNNGLELRAQARHYRHRGDQRDLYVLQLNCGWDLVPKRLAHYNREAVNGGSRAQIALVVGGPNGFVRAHCDDEDIRCLEFVGECEKVFYIRTADAWNRREQVQIHLIDWPRPLTTQAQLVCAEKQASVEDWIKESPGQAEGLVEAACFGKDTGRVLISREITPASASRLGPHAAAAFKSPKGLSLILPPKAAALELECSRG